MPNSQPPCLGLWQLRFRKFRKTPDSGCLLGIELLLATGTLLDLLRHLLPKRCVFWGKRSTHSPIPCWLENLNQFRIYESVGIAARSFCFLVSLSISSWIFWTLPSIRRMDLDLSLPVYAFMNNNKVPGSMCVCSLV